MLAFLKNKTKNKILPLPLANDRAVKTDVGTLLALLDINVRGDRAKKEDIEQFLYSSPSVLWTSFILFCLGSWLAGFAIGYGLLGLIGTQVSSEESRFTVLIAAGIAFTLLLAAYLVFVRFKGVFPRMLAVAAALGSEYLIVFALAGEGYSPIWAAVAALVLLVLQARLITDAAHQIGSAAIFCFMLTYTVITYVSFYVEPVVVALTFPVALLALFYPMRGLDLRPLGMVFLICPLVLAFVNEFTGAVTVLADGSARIVYAGFFMILLYLLWPSLSVIGKKFISITIVPLLLFGLLTSFGIMSSLVVLFMSYMLSSRLVFTVGLITNIIFTVMFYMNLEASLDEKGALMMISGLVILGVILWLKYSLNKTAGKYANKDKDMVRE